MKNKKFISLTALPCHQNYELAPRCFREEVYNGKVFRWSATRAASSLVEQIQHLLARQFSEEGDPRYAQFIVPPEEYWKRIGAVRREISTNYECKSFIGSILEEMGLDRDDYLLDVPRLRAVWHMGHHIEKAAAAYSVHRDTWYANPQAQINTWMPIYNVSAQQTFRFFPDYFSRPIQNDSSMFDYSQFQSIGGWQNLQQGVVKNVYPTTMLEGIDDSTTFSFELKAGEGIFFSAAHLHQTLFNVSGMTRFSIDFRLLHRQDYDDGKGAVNWDNKSRGSTVKDFVHFSNEGVTEATPLSR
jgi:hypothetical protein